jgi:hypothetical protein
MFQRQADRKMIEDCPSKKLLQSPAYKTYHSLMAIRQKLNRYKVTIHMDAISAIPKQS